MITTRISFLGNLHGGSVVASYPFDSGTEKPRGWDAKGIYSEGKISNEHLLLPKRGKGYHNWTYFRVLLRSHSKLTRYIG